ncbi:MAG: hypothetical protein U0414_15770 [Polyangiaceae bacterium]
MKTRTMMGLAVVSSALFFSSSALAQELGGGAKTTEAEGGYGYEFADDPLNAGGFGPGDATIRVRPVAVRSQLIKPRTSFVPEMLKSVENL